MRFKRDSASKPFTRLWVGATIAYAALMVGALYVYSQSDRDWNLPPHLPVAAFAPVVLSLGLLPLYTREVWLDHIVFSRSTDPIKYWAFVATMLALGVVMFLGGIGAFAA